MGALSRSGRRFTIATIYVLGAGWGIQSALAAQESIAPFLISLCLAFACMVWCVVDARVRGTNLVWPARIGVLFFWPIGVPIYLIWSRGLRGLGYAFALGFAWLMVMYIAFLIAGYAAYGPEWFRSGR